MMTVNDVWDNRDEHVIPDEDGNTTNLYTEEEYKKDKLNGYIKTGVEYAKLYGPPLTLAAVSIFCILSGANIMKKRNVALAAVYKVVEESYGNYRQRVVDDLGEEKDKEYYYGVKEETVEKTVTDKDGKEKVVKEKVKTASPSMYGRIFNPQNSEEAREGDPEYNLMYLKQQQNYMNDQLALRGHVMLNDVYDALGFDRTPEGFTVGWLYEGEGDGHIDFNIFDGDVDFSPFIKQFQDIPLDFNVDGPVFDKI